MDEKALEKKLNKFAKANNVISIKLDPSHAKGIPDRLFIRDNKVVFLELKGEGKLNTATKIQKWWIQRLQKQNFKAEITDNYDIAVELLNKHL